MYSQDLYSRQIGAYGLEAMTKLVQLKVLFVGVTGVGIEAAKNITLAGAHTVALWDENPIEVCGSSISWIFFFSFLVMPIRIAVFMRLFDIDYLYYFFSALLIEMFHARFFSSWNYFTFIFITFLL